MSRTKAKIDKPPAPRNRPGDATSRSTTQKVGFAPGLLDLARQEPSDNMVGKAMRDLNFLVPDDFHMRFKDEANKRRMKMKDMLYLMFDQWTQEHPAGVDRQLKRASSQ